ncbi:hypothetical protein BGX34_009417 [Mortierella sp. NVP85]|nr:hypothetical protein BGX34_009417 [Mortierella sp. NVP85]
MLESLELHAYGWKSSEPPTVTGDWSHLKKVFIIGWEDSAHLDFIFKRVGKDLQNMVDVEKDEPRSGLDIQQVSKAFGSHFNTLVDVDLLTPVTVLGSAIPDLLCFCSSLEKLQVKRVSARDVAERGPWVCQQIRELKIQFAFAHGERDMRQLQQLMFERLSTLVRLERLTLNYDNIDYRDGSAAVLDCRLDCGLGRLVSLQQLTSFQLNTPSINWLNCGAGMEEVKWILENWKQLKVIGGGLSQHSELRTQLESVFEAHGIMTVRSPPQTPERVMLPKSPMEIQEIADHVASYLEGENLASCVLVSKSWREVFLPHRWRVVRLGFMDHSPTFHFGPDLDNIYNHRHLVQHLSLVKGFAGFDKLHYPNLRRLVIAMDGSGFIDNFISMDLTAMAPSLVSLELASADVALAFWETLSEHSHIRNLFLEHIWLHDGDLPGLWKTCVKLESLQMYYVKIEDGGSLGNVVFDRLRKLELYATDLSDVTYQLQLILQSPILESLDWVLNGLTVTGERAVNSHWPHLKQLRIDSCIDDTELALMLNGIGSGLGSLNDLGLFNCTLRTQASNALSTHFSTLVKVDLIGSYTSGSTTLDILCSCPKLEILLALEVFARDIPKRGPWVCQQLRVLRIWFRFGESERDLQEQVFERLSTLIHLERLTLEYPITGRGDIYAGLEFRLDCGLGRLASLQQLNCLCFGRLRSHSHYPQVDIGEVAWMVEHWKKLKCISGPLNSHNEVRNAIVSVFESHGIDVRR